MNTIQMRKVKAAVRALTDSEIVALRLEAQRYTTASTEHALRAIAKAAGR